MENTELNLKFYLSRFFIFVGLSIFIFKGTLRLILGVLPCTSHEDILTGFNGMCDTLSMFHLITFLFLGQGMGTLLLILASIGIILALLESKKAKRNLIKDPFLYIVLIFLGLYFIPWGIFLK